MKLGFDHERYIQRQSKYILERVKGWDKLYLEFGGKLMYDLHAKRCLPGYKPNAKLELLRKQRIHSIKGLTEAFKPLKGQPRNQIKMLMYIMPPADMPDDR